MLRDFPKLPDKWQSCTFKLLLECSKIVELH